MRVFHFFFTFYTPGSCFHVQIFGFLHGQKFVFTGKNLRIFTGSIIFSREVFEPSRQKKKKKKKKRKQETEKEKKKKQKKKKTRKEKEKENEKKKEKRKRKITLID